MQQFKLIVFASLVASCLFHVEGFPADDKWKDEGAPSSSYFDYATSFAYCGAQLLGSACCSLYNVLPDTDTLLKTLGLSNVSKTVSDNTDVYEVLPKLIIGQSHSAEGGLNYETAVLFLERFSAMAPSFKKTADAFKAVSYVINEIRREMMSADPNIDAEAFMKEAVHVYLEDGDEALKKKLIHMSPLVFEAALGDLNSAWIITYALIDRDRLDEELKKTGYSPVEFVKTVATQVTTYAKLLKTANDDDSFASIRKGMAGSSVISGMGTASQFTLEALSKAFSMVDTTSLEKTLDLSGDPPKNLDLTEILQRLIIGQCESGINLETVLIFLERLSIVVPRLRGPLDKYRTVSYIIFKIQKMHHEKRKIDAYNVMKGVLDVYFIDVDEPFKDKLDALSPLIYDAALGNKDAAWKVANALADRDTLRQVINAMGYKNQVDLIMTVIEQVATYARLVRTAKEGASGPCP